MWQEARKQEKIIKGIMVDYKRRAERRKGYYEKIKKDPAHFLQIWGRQCKIHIDPILASAADNPSIMTKWQGDEETLIDRFDVRSNLDFLEEYKPNNENEENLTETDKNEQQILNYERFRTLVQNEAVGISETQCLKQIELDEKYGSASSSNSTNDNNKKLKENSQKAQIGYVYEDNSASTISFQKIKKNNNAVDNNNSDEESEDLDMELDIDKLTSEYKAILNKCATNYGMEFGDYIRMLVLENEEKEEMKKNKLLEAERAQFSGRKSRRERRIAKEKRLKERGELSPLSYIIRENKNETERDEESTDDDENESKSSRSRQSSPSPRSSSKYYKKNKTGRSRSPQHLNKNNTCFITSFGASNTDNYVFNETNNAAEDAILNLKKSTAHPTLNLKLLKRSLSSSRSRSKSPISFKKSINIKNEDNKKTASSDEDEDEDYKNYLKRRANRLIQADNRGDDINKYTNNKNDIPCSSTALSSNNTNNQNKNERMTSSSNSASKFRSSEDFKLYHEKLKKKMQKQINQQFKQDQKIEKEKKRKEMEERREREAELEYLTEKVREKRAKERRKQREERGSDHSRSRSSTRSRSRSRSRSRNVNKSRRYSRSSSRSSSSNRRSYRRRKSYSRSRSRTRSKSREKYERRRHRNSSSSSSSGSRIRYRSTFREKNRKRSSSTSSSSTSSSKSSSSSSRSYKSNDKNRLRLNSSARDRSSS